MLAAIGLIELWNILHNAHANAIGNSDILFLLFTKMNQEVLIFLFFLTVCRSLTPNPRLNEIAAAVRNLQGAIQEDTGIPTGKNCNMSNWLPHPLGSALSKRNICEYSGQSLWVCKGGFFFTIPGEFCAGSFMKSNAKFLSRSSMVFKSSWNFKKFLIIKDLGNNL